MLSFKKNGEKKGQQHANVLSKNPPNVEWPRPAQQLDRAQVASGFAGHENPPQSHDPNQQRNSHQLRASAPTREQPSEIRGGISRAVRFLGFGDKGHEGEGKETMPTLEQLQQAFERFKRDQYSKSSFPDVIQYVQALQAENNKLTRSRDEAKTALGGLGNTAMSLISKLHPASAIEEMAQKDQFTASGALNFLLEHYTSLWETNDSNFVKISTMDGENKRLRQELGQRDISHRQEVEQIRRDCQGHLDREERRHSDEKEGITTLYHSQLHKLEDKHKREVTELKQTHEDLLNVLDIGHQKELTDVKSKLGEDIRTLQVALMSFVDRFQPRPDNELRLQFDGLKASVGRVARSPSDVGAEELGARLDRTTFVRLAPPRHHKFALESRIWAILMDGMFASPFTIFDDYSAHFFSTLWSQIVQDDQRPTNPDIEKWRCFTFDSLRRAVTKNTTTRPADEMIRENYERNRAKIFRSLSALFSQVSSQDRQAEIRNIVDMACSLALDCGEQRCRLELFAPGLKHKVSRQDVKTYRDMNGDNDPSLAEGIVQLVVSPGLRRIGDGRGGSLDQIFDLCPASVYLTETS